MTLGCPAGSGAGPLGGRGATAANTESLFQMGAMADLSKPISGTCRVAVQLWTIVGGSHSPSIASSTKQFFINWFKATPPNHP